MTIKSIQVKLLLREILKRLFLEYRQAIFQVDSHRYHRLFDDELDEFRRSVYDEKFSSGDLASDRKRIREDLNHVLRDFRNALKAYKGRIVIKHGQGK